MEDVCMLKAEDRGDIICKIFVIQETTLLEHVEAVYLFYETGS